YCSAKEGFGMFDLEKPEKTLSSLLDFMVSDYFPEPNVSTGPNLQLLVTNLSYSAYVGPLIIGRIQRGVVNKAQQYRWVGDGKEKTFKVSTINVYQGLSKGEVESASAGEIVIISGLEGAQIGDSICSLDSVEPLPRISVEPPTVAVNVSVSTSPLSGQEGDYLTSRKLEEFLEGTVRLNVALQYEGTEDPKIYKLKGRGELQLAIVFEELRRKGFEFMVSRPEVLTITENEKVLEPFEKLVLDVPESATGALTELLAKRKGIMEGMQTLASNRTRIEFIIPTRGLIGLRSIFLTETRGEGLMSSYFIEYRPFLGSMLSRTNGAIISDRKGRTTPYALFNLLSSGKQFVRTGEDVYEGMVIGEHTRANDLNVNCIKGKVLSSMRTAGKDENIVLPPIQDRTLDWALDWIEQDEWVEVTPKNIRIRKKMLEQNKRSVIRK
ncbi:translational GTPase TypA, partial [Bacteriovoracaceae bacterium]|nr:translational GTPase TypA [Bacteriovoracaceae bacterium]